MGDNNYCTAEGFMLRDLTIQNYRCFKDFHIDDLARVNLIVGMNNSGKTTLLETVDLLVNQGNIYRLIDFIKNRGEIAEPPISVLPGETQRRSIGYQVRHIFYGHQLDHNQIISLQSQEEYPLFLKIQFSRYSYHVPTPTPAPSSNAIPKPSSPSEIIETEHSGFMLYYSYERNNPYVGIPATEDGIIAEQSFPSLRQNQIDTSVNPQLPNFFLTTDQLSFEQLAVFWNDILLTANEERVVAALQVLEPSVERIGFTSNPNFNIGIKLKLRGQDEPVPLGSMGEGMRRILTLAMAAVTVENGFLLVDEIDTGLYYESQTDMWRLILEIAQQLNIQVFATTHSWDCISAFQEALEQLEDSSVGKLFRLSHKGENIRPVAYTADELAIAIPHSIEVR